MITEKTVITTKGVKSFIADEKELCRVMYSLWRKDTDSKSFQAWADELNETGDYEGTFCADDAMDNLASAFHLNIGSEVPSVFEFFKQHSAIQP